MTLTGWTYSSLIPMIAASAILLAGVVDDLRSRKFHNWLFLVCSAFGLVVATVVGGATGAAIAAIGFMAGIAILLPLVLMKIVGAGDMKLLAAFGLVAGWNAVLSVTVFAFIWGGLFGVIRTALSGQLGVLAHNMISIVSLKERSQLQLQTIPFTVAIFFGWLTHLVYERLV